MANDSGPQLRRSVGGVQLAMYGVGSMLGAGIYGLIGVAAGVMGSAIWLAFLASMVAALLTGLTYASIGSRYPKAAGAAYVAHRAFGLPLLSYVVGLAVICSGLSSIATQSKVVANSLQALFGPLQAVPIPVLAVVFILVLAAVLFRGIKESLLFNTICTIVEVAGLVFVIAVGARYWGTADLTEMPVSPDGGLAALVVLQGAVLTFFSFIGFEDTLNVAEEVKEPERNLPLALMAALIVATILYLGVAVTAVSVIPWRELAQSQAPLATVVAKAAPWFPTVGFGILTIFAVSNTALVNYVMGSRLLYGLSSQGLAPRFLSAIHADRRTPHMAIVVLFVVAVALSMLGDISQLASATVLLLLFVFVLINIAYLVLKLRKDEPKSAFEAPAFVPLLGAAVCAALIMARVLQGDWRAPAIAGGLLAVLVVLYFLTGRPTGEAVAHASDIPD